MRNMLELVAALTGLMTLGAVVAVVLLLGMAA